MDVYIHVMSYRCIHREGRGQCLVFPSIMFYLIPLRQSLSAGFGVFLLWPACWGFELRSWYLHSKRFYHLALFFFSFSHPLYLQVLFASFLFPSMMTGDCSSQPCCSERRHRGKKKERKSCFFFFLPYLGLLFLIIIGGKNNRTLQKGDIETDVELKI